MLLKLISFLKRRHPESKKLEDGGRADHSIKELAEMVAKLVGYSGPIKWDPSKPDGMPRKCLDITKMSNMNLHVEVSPEDGICGMIDESRESIKNNHIQ